MGKLALQMWRMCLRKKKYRSEHLAMQVAEKIKKDRGITLYVYACPLCGYYHLTKKERFNNGAKENS